MADEALSYNELNSRANCLARTLISNGAGAGSLVGISCERSIEMAIAVLGTLIYLAVQIRHSKELLERNQAISLSQV